MLKYYSTTIILLLFYNNYSFNQIGGGGGGGVDGYNIAVDITKHGVETYIGRMRPYFKEKLANWVVSDMKYSTLFCGIKLQRARVKNLKIGGFGASTEGKSGDYHLKLTDVNFTIFGVYDRNFLFIHTSHPYTVNISIPFISIGPLIPIRADGLPFIDSTLNCEFGKTAISRPTTGGWLVGSLIRNAVDQHMEHHLCSHFIEKFDDRLRANIGSLELHFPIVHNSSTLDYRIFSQPIILPSKSIRYQLDGSTVDLRQVRGSPFNPDDVANNSSVTKMKQQQHVVFYIHEKLLTQISETLCHSGYFDSNFTSFPSNEPVSYICLTTDVKIDNKSKTPNLFLGITSVEKYENSGKETQQFRTFMLKPLYNAEFELMIRLKSQLADSSVDNTFNAQLFTHLSSILLNDFTLPLPLVLGYSITDINLKFNNAYITIMANLQPDTQK